MGEDEGVAAGAAPTDALQERRGEQVQMRQDGSASHAVRESQEETSSEVEKGTTEKVRGPERPATRTKAKGRKTEERIHEAQRDEAKDTTRDEGEAGTGQVGEGPSRSVDSPNSRASPRRSRLRSRDPPKPPSPSSLSSPSLHASLSAPSVVDADALEASTDLGCPHVGENETPREGEAEREEAKDETGRVRRGEPPGGYSLRARRSRARELWKKREEGGDMSRRADSAAHTERLHEEEQRETEIDAANGEDRGGPSRKRRVGERERRPATPARTAAGLAATERRREEVRGSSRRCCSRGRGSGGVALSQGGAWTYAKTEGTESGSRGAGRQTPRGAAAGEKKRRQDTEEKEERKQDKESEARVESRTPRYFPASPATKARSKNAGVTLRVSAEKRKSTRAEERDASSSGKCEDRPPSALGSGTPARPSSPAAGFQGKPPLHAQRQMHTGNAPCNSTSLSTPSSPASVDTIGGFPRDAFERFDQPFLQVTLTEVSSRNRWKATASYEDKVESLLKEGVARSTCFRREAPSSLTICKQYDWKNHQAMFEDEDRTTYYRKAIFWRGWEQHERRREAQSRGLRATSLLEDNFPGNVEQRDPGGEAGREDESENKDANAASMPRLHASGPGEETQEAERGKKSGGEKKVGGEDVQEMTNDGVRRRVATSELAQLEGTSNCRLFREERRLGDARGLSGVETQDEDEESGEEELDDGVVDVKSFRPCSGSLENDEEGERGVKKKRTYVQGKRVLEIGTGPIALLAVLAVKAGAEYVDALEVSKTSASLATSFVRQFGLNSSASRDVFPACSLSPSTSTLARASPATPAALSTPSSPSTSLSPHAPASFPCYYDMVIHEILGDFASQEGAADVYLDIQRRLGYCPKSIPTAATTCVAPCAFPTRENIPYKATDHPERTIFSPRRRLFQSVSLQFSSLLLCDSLLPMEELRFEEPMERQMLQRRRLEFTVTRRGLFAGFLAAIDVEIRPGRHFGTVFEQQCDSWYTNVVLLGKEIEVRPRDRITLFTIADLKNYQVETVPQSVGKKKQAVQMEVSRPTYTFQGFVERPRQGVVAEFGPIHIDYDEQASCIRIE